MNRRVSIGEIVFLAVELIALLLLGCFFSPPVALVLSCIGVGAAFPALARIGRALLPKSLRSLPFFLVLFVLLPMDRYFPAVAHRPVVFLATFVSAFGVGGSLVEFSLRPFFPLKSREKHT